MLSPLLAGCTTYVPGLVDRDPERLDILPAPADPLACPGATRLPAPPGAAVPAAPPGVWEAWFVDAAKHVPPPPPARDPGDMEAAELLSLQDVRTSEQEARALEVEATPVGEAWSRRFLEVAHAHTDDGKGSPPRQAYRMAVLHAVMWDAYVVALRAQDCYARPFPALEVDGLRPLFEPEARGSYPSEHAAVAAAAATLMEAFYPNLAGEFWPDAREVGQTRLVAGVARTSDVDAGLELGRRVAQEVLRARRGDGHEAPPIVPERPDGPCVWTEAPPSYGLPMDPNWGEVMPFAVGVDAPRPRAPAPPECGSEEWLAQAKAVYDVSFNVTPEQRKIALRWAGSPPLDWLEIALDATSDASMDSAQQLRTLAHLGVALADAGIVAWDTKYTHWTERPIHTIRREFDPEWSPIVPSPAFPGYVSGHSTFSGAASVVLGAFLPEEAAAFDALAEEAMWSRFWGGIHIMADNEEGMTLGREVGAAALRVGGGSGAGAPASP